MQHLSPLYHFYLQHVQVQNLPCRAHQALNRDRKTDVALRQGHIQKIVTRSKWMQTIKTDGSTEEKTVTLLNQNN